MWSCQKVRFTCPMCKETFNVQTKYLMQKEKVYCPCCEFEVPHEVLSGIKGSIKEASKAFVFVRDNKLGLEFDFIPYSE